MSVMSDFSGWLSQNGLTEAFTTGAGDTLYTNVEKLFGVLKKANQYGVASFYLDNIVGFQTFDDEHIVAAWDGVGVWRYFGRNTNYSTNEVYMMLYLKNQQPLKLQLFRGTHGNIRRDSIEHMRLFDYACQMSEYFYNLVNALRK